MEAVEPSRTALVVAAGRGRHRLYDDQPWIFDDPYALPLVGPEWPGIVERVQSLFSHQVEMEAVGGLMIRSRYAEDRLEEGSFEQYVILGAGLDSFAWRRPDLVRSVRVFEVDHPATQAWKKNRAAVLALPTSDRHVFASVDFEAGSLADGLDAAGFNWAKPTLFSWLGVTYYLTVDAIEDTLRVVSRSGPGSEIVFSYAPTAPFLDPTGAEFSAVFSQIAAASGEPMQTFFAPSDVEGLVTRCGLEVADHPSLDSMRRRYVTGRTDGLSASTAERCLVGRVPDSRP
jgi:methyltransferase (TIGR00027 family)